MLRIEQVKEEIRRKEFIELSMAEEDRKLQPEEMDGSFVLEQDPQGTFFIAEFNFKNEENVNESLITRGIITLEKIEEAPLPSKTHLKKPGHTPSNVFIKTMRNHFLPLILEALQGVQPHVASPDAAVYIYETLHSIREMEKRSPKDSFLEVLFAFYDALAANGLWATYSENQFAKASKILSMASKKQPLRPEVIEKAIIQLEEVGFDTTPYSMDLNEKTKSKCK